VAQHHFDSTQSCQTNQNSYNQHHEVLKFIDEEKQIQKTQLKESNTIAKTLKKK
jgi:hypothetical protein